MSFSIEVPAETTPLTNQFLFQILQSAASNNPAQIQSGTKQLQHWETSPGFFSTLQSIFLDRSLPEDVRNLAILQLKNGIDKYWRKTAQNAISKTEKVSIRSRCLESCLNEPRLSFALQAAVVIGKVVRYDYPHDWLDAITSAVHSVKEASQLTNPGFRLSRALLVLLFVVKELSTAKLQRSRAALQSAAPSITEVLFRSYQESIQRWDTFLNKGGDDEGGAIESMEHSLLALRTLRRLVLQFDFPNRQDFVRDIWQSINQHFDHMLGYISPERGALLTDGPRALVERHVVQFTKLHLNMARSHPAAFALFPNITHLLHAYWMLIRQHSDDFGIPLQTTPGDLEMNRESENETSFGQKMTLQGLLVLRACDKMAFNPIHTFKYQQAEDKEEKRLAREKMQTEVFTLDFAAQMMEILATRYFVYTSSDLRQWEDEPEEWFKSQEGAGDDWELSIRTCAEKLFLDLVVHFKDGLIPQLINILRAGLSTIGDALRKDSIYAAIGLAAPVLEQQFDFATFLRDNLVPEVQISGPGSSILRRRIAIVLGQWLPVKEGLDRPLVYQIFQHLTDKNEAANDLVVRITAARQLHDVIDPFEFDAEQFVPSAPNIIDRLMPLMQEVDMTETKLALLNTLSLIVTKMEHHILPFSDQIVSQLPALWSQNPEEYIIKQAILGILTRLITSLKSESAKYHGIIIPLIQSSVDPNSDAKEYLLEDALDLWDAMLQEAIAPPPAEMVALVQYLFPLFEVGSDALRKSLDIAEAYIYLIPSEILHNAQLLLKPYSVLLGTVKSGSVGMVTHLVELLLQSALELGGASAVKEITVALMSSGFFTAILDGLEDAYESHQTTGPNRRLPIIDGIVETDYLGVVARLGISGSTFVLSACHDTMPNASINWLIEEWFAHMDNISSSEQRKLSCLALTTLFETGEPWALSRLQAYISMWTDLITELVSETEDEAGHVSKVDCLVYTSPDALKPEGPESPGAARQRQLLWADPVHRVDIRDFVRQKLSLVIEKCGGMESFQQQWLENVDKDVVRAFGELGIF